MPLDTKPSCENNGQTQQKPTLKRRSIGGVLLFIGFMLSPLSWWNDAFVNLPLAVAFGWIISLFYKPAFGVSVVVGYWLSNVLGFVLMHKGGQKMLGKEGKGNFKREIIKDLVISFLYTSLILALLHFKVLQPFQNYQLKW